MSDTELTSEDGQFEDRQESTKSKEDFVARWMAEIDLASKSEEKWRKAAETARDVYRAEGKAESQRFNILFSNVQTEVPALYNSTPTPDVRTRYHDDDEASRLAGQAIERVLSFSVDQYNFDDTIKGSVQDRQLAGRGQARVRYKVYEYQGKGYQEVCCEHVPWKHYLFGPCTEPSSRPWEAFEHFLTRSQLEQLNPEIGGGINLDFTLGQGSGRSRDKNPDAAPNVYRRARVWEIWDKQTRKVIWIAPGHKLGPIRVDDDPLGLVGFYATPDPMYAIRTSDSTVPKCPYDIIKPLADELEELTIRIQELVKVCKWRGFRHPAIPFEKMEEAVDGELVAPTDGAEILTLIQNGTLEKAIWLMPIEQLIKTIQQLYVQRDQTINTIFQVSGLADIMRGSTDPNETATAQEIKSNFGTMRLQDSQKDVARFCRDLFRLKAEIACNLFDSQNLAMMTGLKQPSREQVMMAQMQLRQSQMPPQLPPPQPQGGPPQAGPPGQPPPPGPPGQPTPGMLVPQGPPQPPQPQEPDEELEELANAVSWEEILEILKSGMMRMYRIDIETDSTIRGDVNALQQQAGLFLDGTAKYVQAMAPIVQAGMMPGDVAVDLFAGLARAFKLGKQAEDALARWGHEASKKAKNPAPPQPSPEEMKLQADQQRFQAELEFKKQSTEQDMMFRQKDMELKQQEAAQSAQLKQQEFEHNAKLKEAEFQHQAGLEQYKIQAQTELETKKMEGQRQLQEADLAHRQAMGNQEAQLKHAQFEREGQNQEREFQHKIVTQTNQEAFEREKFGHQREMDHEAAQSKAGNGTVSGPGEKPVRVNDAMQHIAHAMSDVAEIVKALRDAQAELIKAQSRPKRIVRDPKTNRAIGVESV